MGTVRAVWSLIRIIVGAARSSFRTKRELALENLALRHQIGVLTRALGDRHPRFGSWHRALWVVLARRWEAWRYALAIVQPATVIRWHREGFKRFWTRRSRAGRVGRPALDRELVGLIRKMSRSNVTWGAPRIRNELAKLGIEVAVSIVARHMVRERKPTSPRPSPRRRRRAISCGTETGSTAAGSGACWRSSASRRWSRRRDHRGRTRTRSGSSARFDGNAWITSPSLARSISSESWLGTSSTTTGLAATFHWWAMRRNPGRRKDPNSAGWLSCLRSAGCIIVTSALRPDAMVLEKGRGDGSLLMYPPARGAALRVSDVNSAASSTTTSPSRG